jgi:hypothetical protein
MLVHHNYFETLVCSVTKMKSFSQFDYYIKTYFLTLLGRLWKYFFFFDSTSSIDGVDVYSLDASSTSSVALLFDDFEFDSSGTAVFEAVLSDISEPSTCSSILIR